MENFKFSLVSFFLILILAGIGVLAYLALERGDESGLKQKVASLESQIAQHEKELAERDRTIAQLESDLTTATRTETSSTPTTTPEQESTSSTTTSSSSTTDSSLLSDLRSLRSRGIVLEPGDSGGSVRIIQTFLNTYNNTSGGVDGDFGPGTRAKVEDFQESEGITVDGGVGSGTLGTMISWLEANQ